MTTRHSSVAHVSLKIFYLYFTMNIDRQDSIQPSPISLSEVIQNAHQGFCQSTSESLPTPLSQAGDGDGAPETRCAICGKFYARRNLTHHMRRSHDSGRHLSREQRELIGGITCQLCNAFFTSQIGSDDTKLLKTADCPHNLLTTIKPLTPTLLTTIAPLAPKCVAHQACLPL